MRLFVKAFVAGFFLVCSSAMAEGERGFAQNRVNVRACPSTDSCSVVVVLSPRSEFDIIGKSGDWLQIVTIPDKKIGWVSSKYVGHTLEASLIKKAYPPDAQELWAIKWFNRLLLLTVVLAIVSGIVMGVLSFGGKSRLSSRPLIILLTSPRIVISWIIAALGAYLGWLIASKVPLEWSTSRGGMSYLPKLFGYVSWVLYWGVPLVFRFTRRAASKLLVWGCFGVSAYIFVIVCGLVAGVYFSVFGGGLLAFILYWRSLIWRPASRQITTGEIDSNETSSLEMLNRPSEESDSERSTVLREEEQALHFEKHRLEREVEQLQKAAEEKEAWEKQQAELEGIRKKLETPDWQ